jgi:arginine deiminase
MVLGSQSEIASLRTILLKHPSQAWLNQETVRAQWKALGYAEEPDYGRAVAEYDRFIEILRRYVQDIHFLPEDSRTGLDSIYVRDAALATRHGLVLCNMGKKLRRGEPAAVSDYCRAAVWPVLGAIRGPGSLEGGDVVWLDEQTLAVGHGYRTNAEGIRQLREILGGFVETVVEVPLPHWNGPRDVLHLMSLISPVDKGRLLVYSRLLPAPFRLWLLERGFELVEVADQEYQGMGANVLAVAPGKCIALAGNPRTTERLAKAGVEVWTYEGRDISWKGAGGPTCLTRPVIRIPG